MRGAVGRDGEPGEAAGAAAGVEGGGAVVWLGDAGRRGRGGERWDLIVLRCGNVHAVTSMGFCDSNATFEGLDGGDTLHIRRLRGGFVMFVPALADERRWDASSFHYTIHRDSLNR